MSTAATTVIEPEKPATIAEAPSEKPAAVVETPAEPLPPTPEEMAAKREAQAMAARKQEKHDEARLMLSGHLLSGLMGSGHTDLDKVAVNVKIALNHADALLKELGV